MCSKMHSLEVCSALKGLSIAGYSRVMEMIHCHQLCNKAIRFSLETSYAILQIL